NAGVQRFVMISAMHADNRQAWQQSKIKPYMVAKHYADRFLKSSGLDYTILQPGRLLDKKGIGKITITNPTDAEGIAREDVAEMVLAVLRN
ncbi:MAG: NAD(P)H-binding protein, partial [Aliifodinibius sp.]|nr:SDR family oxidoreductase [candidate division Zixibacteria bacterium]NIT59018.1 SDR family oxidoreductase [Fodinibius sp.]NIW46652.1 NAD(P)H-binding protein [Gammaproteobacteria bacterium]NIS47266.1 SDR family oxidoreductase [candidate division Zixibacteria bacterium]NIU15395.1 SDR family oxidoreductase [candidate division Zixibacteria bacterium]